MLVVDDHANNRDLLQRRLRKVGFHVVIAQGGAEALALLEDEGVDLVLLDIMMPGLDGHEVLARLRESWSPSALPVIMVTAKEGSTDLIDALNAGANDYVTKPIDFPVLLARIEAQLARQRAEAALEQLNRELEERVQSRTKQIHATNSALRRSEQRYRALYDNNPAMFFTLDREGVILSVNRFGAEQLGYAPEDLLGQPVAQLYESEEIAGKLHACFALSDEVHRWELEKSKKSGERIWTRETARLVHDACGTAQLLLVSEDITESRRLASTLSYQATHDILTGLTNRGEFERRLERVLDTVQSNRTEHVVCFIDLDQFKVVNDSCGHIAGDALLRQLGGLLRKHVRERDTLARLGGDEFGILLEHCCISAGQRVAQAILDAIESFRFVWEQKTFALSASLGMTRVDEFSTSRTTVLATADAACYVAKDAGRNRIHIHCDNDAQMQQRQQELSWVVRVQEALDQGSFELACQAIVPVSDPREDFSHYEVLLRLREPDGTLVAPGCFLPAAERYNLSARLDRWVVNSALNWLGAQPAHTSKLRLCSVNLSGMSLGDPSFLQYVLDRLHESRVPSEKVCFEITETAAISNLEAATHFMGEVKKLGCQFALDDFGTGLSSFAYLRSLPVDYLKIDGLFIKNIAHDPVDFAMVRSINEIGHVLGKRTIAEFVENEAVLEKLKEIGVDYAQGYGIGRPRPMAKLVGLQAA